MAGFGRLPKALSDFPMSPSCPTRAFLIAAIRRRYRRIAAAGQGWADACRRPEADMPQYRRQPFIRSNPFAGAVVQNPEAAAKWHRALVQHNFGLDSLASA